MAERYVKFDAQGFADLLDDLSPFSSGRDDWQDFVSLSEVAAAGHLEVWAGPALDVLRGSLPDETGETAPDGNDHMILALRSLPVHTTRLSESHTAATAGLRIDRTFGPFLDRFGREWWIDLFRTTRFVRLRETTTSQPFLVLPLRLATLVTSGPRHNWTVPRGSVWLATRLLDGAAPPQCFTSLRVEGGTLQFDAPVLISSDELVISPSAGFTLTLDLSPVEPPPGTGPGGDARASQVKLPNRVGFRFDASGARVMAVADGGATLYGTALVVSAATGPLQVEYLADHNRLAVAMTADRADVEILGVKSTLAQPQGKALLTRTAWGLPAAVTDANHLGEASGDSVLMFWLDDGLSMTWNTQPDPLPLGKLVLSLDPSRLSLVAANAVTSYIHKVFNLAAGKAAERLALRWEQKSPISFISQASGSETLALEAQLNLRVGNPVDLAGEPLPLRAEKANLFLIQDAGGDRLMIQAQVDRDLLQRVVGLGLVNGVLITHFPNLLAIVAAYQDDKLLSGLILMRFPLRQVIPTLPDPYASNTGIPRQSFPPHGSFAFSLLRWQPDERHSDILAPDVPLPQALPLSQSKAMPQDVETATFSSSQDGGNREQLSEALKQSGDAFDFERNRGLILLDVSTNAGQYGVAIRPRRHDRPPLTHVAPAAGQGHTQAVVRDMQLQLAGPGLSLITLPAVQWEVVWTEHDPDPFPPRLSFANNGVPTVFSVPTANLIPVQPARAIDRIIDNFAAPLAESREVDTRFTLPFGIVARAFLRKAKDANSRSAAVTLNQPRRDHLEGSLQLSIEASDSSLPADASAALAGFAVQFPVGLPGGRGTIGDSATTIFNTYLGAFGARPMVPVSRIDISGYGESLFSDWRNPFNDPAVDAVAVTQARFDVLVGRTALEIVQVRSKLFCYGVDVVRTVTIERRNSGVVSRHDSGWQAASDGLYDFGPGIVTHPGVVRRITKVVNIRETGQVITVDGKQLAAVRFDGELHLEGAAPVLARGHLGYVQITAGALISAATYAKLVDSAGKLGGDVDATLAIGSGPQHMRLNRVGIGVTPGMGGPEFAMAAWGAPVFPAGGQWSFLRIDDPTAAPKDVDRSLGVPLVRAGAAAAPPPATSPYRFADPEDLLRPGNPDTDYAVLHAMGTQRVLFPRPKIEATDPSRITSTRIPLLADSFGLATSEGSFPLPANCIPFPSNAWALRVQAGNHYRLEMPATTFPAGVGRRTLQQAGKIKGDVDYSQAKITYEVDTAAAPAWRFAMDQVDKIMNSSDLGDVITFRATLQGDSTQPTRIDSPQLRIGDGMEVVRDILTLLANLGVTGTTEVDMTNKWSIKIRMIVPVKDPAGKDLQIPPVVPLPDIKFADTGITVSQRVAPKNDQADFEFSGSPMFSIKAVPGLYAVAILKFSIRLSTVDGTSYKLLIGFGIAYELKATDWLKLKGLFAITVFGVVGDTVLGFGAGFLIKVSADLVIITVTVRLEGKLALVWGCRGLVNESQWSLAKLVFGVDITIAFIFSISFEYEGKTKSLMQGPGEPACALPDII